MAEKRMFAKSIVNSDAFLDMPLSSQALYFHLSMEADDEGFVGNPRRIQRLIGASEDDMKILIAKRYLLEFESGIVVVKHWYINNFIRQDRAKETTYIEERDMLTLDDKKAYTEKQCQPNDNQMTTKSQPRLEENRIEEISDIYNTHVNDAPLDFLNEIPTLQEIKDFITLKDYPINPDEFYDYYTARGWKLNNQPIADWRALASQWARKTGIMGRLQTDAQTRIDQRKQQPINQRENTYKFGQDEITDDEI